MNTTQTTSGNVIQTTRLRIPVSSFSVDPKYAIKQLLGQNIKLISFTQNDIITNDETYIVDVRYKSINISKYDIYYIDVNNMKQIIPDSKEYAFKLNGCNVILNLTNPSDFKKFVPVRITPIVSNNFTTSGPTQSVFNYFATVIRQPLSSLMTPIHYPGSIFTPFDIIEESKLYPESFKPKNIEFNDMVKAYNDNLQLFPLFQHIDKIIPAKTFKDCDINSNIAYVIDFNVIPLTESIPGIIAINDNRIPNYVLYYPTHNFEISAEELEAISSFIKAEEVRYNNFRYVMDELNK